MLWRCDPLAYQGQQGDTLFFQQKLCGTIRFYHRVFTQKIIIASTSPMNLCHFWVMVKSHRHITEMSSVSPFEGVSASPTGLLIGGRKVGPDSGRPLCPPGGLASLVCPDPSLYIQTFSLSIQTWDTYCQPTSQHSSEMTEAKWSWYMILYDFVE